MAIYYKVAKLNIHFNEWGQQYVQFLQAPNCQKCMCIIIYFHVLTVVMFWHIQYLINNSSSFKFITRKENIKSFYKETCKTLLFFFIYNYYINLYDIKKQYNIMRIIYIKIIYYVLDTAFIKYCAQFFERTLYNFMLHLYAVYNRLLFGPLQK